MKCTIIYQNDQEVDKFAFTMIIFNCIIFSFSLFKYYKIFLLIIDHHSVQCIINYFKVSSASAYLKCYAGLPNQSYLLGSIIEIKT